MDKVKNEDVTPTNAVGGRVDPPVIRRELKFRAWDGKYKEWTGYKIDNIDCNNKIFFECSETKKSIIDDDLERFTLMQYTGLKDKNGKEVYEGDFYLHCTTSKIGDIKYGDGKFYCDTKDIRRYDLPNINNGRVIGNIYENPELLVDA